MANLSNWLPSLVLFQAYRGDWERYLQALYAYFAQDFINSSNRSLPPLKTQGMLIQSAAA